MGKLICGASKIKITPPAELIPDLYGLMRTHYAGVIDDLYVRVLFLANETDRTLLVSWDLDKSPNPDVLVPTLSARFDIPEDNILFFAVHTHTAPMHSARPDDGPNGRDKQRPEVQKATLKYEDLLSESLIQAANEAINSAVPAKIGYGEGESYIGENRVADYFVEQEDGSIIKKISIGSNPKGPVDHTLFIIRAEDLNGKPIAFFVNYPVHCCSMILNNFDGKGGVGISPDIAGAVSTLLEDKFPGCTALWSSGAAGNINPIMMNQYNIADPADGKPTDIRDYSTAEPAKLALLMMSNRHFADIIKTNRFITCSLEDADIAGTTELISIDGYLPQGTYNIRLRCVRIGDIALCGVSGELFCTLGWEVKEVSDFAHTVIINHESTFAANSGYILDDDAIIRGTGADGKCDGLPGMHNAMLKPGLISPALKEGAARLFARLKR